ncbi:hypothetical protein BC937DRAFT_90211 [Endogone sp. FLAS-F59071]|nr:hypothetical protein BC937DRAFT_90211 [Endogone sp. FLAS-F59071]|eukprot:RUS17252.1 hypothetical protein BC937DRAFT_90211 [Endogone sp. FLAS-F59071]
MPSVDLKGCEEDSPEFRKRLNAAEDAVATMENSIKNLVKLARAGNDLAIEHSNKQKQFAEELDNFAHLQEDPIVEMALQKFSRALQEVENHRSMFQSHIIDMFIEPLERFAKDDILPTKDIKKRFEKSSDESDQALSRYMAKRPKDPTLVESAKELADARKEFHVRYLEYALKLNDLQAKKKFEFMEYVLALMYTGSAFYHQSYEILKDLEPYMRDLTGLLQDSRQRYNEESQEARNFQEFCTQRTSQEYHPSPELQLPTSATSSVPPSPTSQKPKMTTAITKSGYLYKKNSTRVMQSWTRRYFFIDGEQLVYTTRGRTVKEEDQPNAINLRLCTIKPTDSYDRRFCFEVISPMRILVLQAENESDMVDWVQRLKNASQAALNSDKLPSPRGLGDTKDIRRDEAYQPMTISENDKQLLKLVREMAGNDQCADCQATEPQWASINIGTILCIECSGIHRSLGVHVSKVRSLTLDKWEPESIEVMLRLGNMRTNSIFEAKIQAGEAVNAITPDSTRAEKEAWITDKYVKKKFIKTEKNSIETINLALWNAVNDSDLYEALRNLAFGADVNYKNENKNSFTALHQAISQDDDITVEFLLQWLCDVNAVDGNGWTGLHHAAAANNVRLVLTLLKRQAKVDVSDYKHKTPLDIAVERQHVQSVTALRLFAFDKQHNSSPSNSSDFGFREAMTSFSQPHHIYNRQGSGASHSSFDVRTASLGSPLAASGRSVAELHDDQNWQLLQRSSFESSRRISKDGDEVDRLIENRLSVPLLSKSKSHEGLSSALL